MNLFSALLFLLAASFAAGFLAEDASSQTISIGGSSSTVSVPPPNVTTTGNTFTSTGSPPLGDSTALPVNVTASPGHGQSHLNGSSTGPESQKLPKKRSMKKEALWLICFYSSIGVAVLGFSGTLFTGTCITKKGCCIRKRKKKPHHVEPATTTSEATTIIESSGGSDQMPAKTPSSHAGSSHHSSPTVTPKKSGSPAKKVADSNMKHKTAAATPKTPTKLKEPQRGAKNTDREVVGRINELGWRK